LEKDAKGQMLRAVSGENLHPEIRSRGKLKKDLEESGEGKGFQESHGRREALVREPNHSRF
jgi:hypothetical protein